MKNLFITVILTCFTLLQIQSQNGAAINSSGAIADQSAILDISSNNKGILIPRLTEAQKLSIQSPATGLMIYQTDNTSGFWYFNGNNWVQSIGVSGSTGVTGATGTFQSGNNQGEMLYWDGNAWISIPPANEYGQFLNYCNGVPTWGGCIPILTTNAPSSIVGGAVNSGGTITNYGGTSITSKGICWSTNTNPTIANNYTNNGSGSSSFTSSISNLMNNTVYYIRAYAINSAGIAYGNEVSFTSGYPLNNGDDYLGGKVAYILQPSDQGYEANLQHGIISATTDQSAGITWGCSGTAISGTLPDIGSGQPNTTLIVNSCSTTSAAKTCDNLNTGGYSDWYLPSRSELVKVYNNQALIGGFALTTEYWSSTEYNINTAYAVSFVNGSNTTQYKSNTQKVRCVRSF